MMGAGANARDADGEGAGHGRMRIRRRGRHRRRLGRPFARLWVGFTLASSGDGFAYGAVPLLAVVVNPHPLAVSAVVAADSLPWLFLALPAGAFADRFERGPVMAFANSLRAGAILAAAILVATGHMTLALLIIIVLINAGARATYYSSLQAMVPELVKDDALERANGVLTGTEAGAEYLAGPVVGTTLFAASQSAPFFADAMTLIASCIPFVRFRSKAPAPPEATNSIWEGVRLLFAERRLRVLVLMVGSLSLFQGMESGVLVLLATKAWGVGEGAYGLFLAVAAVGGLVGSALADGQVRRFGSARVLIGAAVLSGIGYLIMASAHTWVVAAPASALVGIAIAVITIVAISLRQRLTPPHLMGRVGSAWRGLVWGAAPVGALIAGGVATLGGLRLPLVLAGALQCVVAVVFARPLLSSTRVDASTSDPHGDDAVASETIIERPPAHHVDPL
jgi:MFS family permease